MPVIWLVNHMTGIFRKNMIFRYHKTEVSVYNICAGLLIFLQIYRDEKYCYCFKDEGCSVIFLIHWIEHSINFFAAGDASFIEGTAIPNSTN